MADEGGGLLIEIGVTQARMERELAKVLKQAGATADQMEKYFNKANDNIGKNSRKPYDEIGKGANAAAPAVKNLSGYTGNLASQLNDIAVQLAGGQSPFQIMLQQGTQIGQIAAQAGGGLKGLGSILAGAFTSVLSPVNLLTFAVIGLSGYAIQYFSDIVSGGDSANGTLEQQTQLVQAVAKSWGDAVPALQAYVDQLERAADVSDLQEVAAQRQRDVLAEINSEFDAFAQKNADIGVLLYQAAMNPQAPLHDLGEAYTQLAEKVANGTAQAEDFKRVSDALNTSPMQAQLANFGNAFQSLAFQVNKATAALATFMTQAGQAVRTKFPSPGNYSGVDRSADGPIQGESFPLPEIGPTPDKRPSTESMYEGGTWTKPPKGRSGGGRGANAYKDEVASIKERTAALQASTAAQAAINPLVNDYGYAMEKAKAEVQLLADAQRAGLAITPQLKEQISALAGSYAQASSDAKRLAESQDEIKKRAQEWASLEKDVFGGFIKDLRDGKSGAEALANALNKVADKLLNMALDDIFSTKSSGGAGGGILGSIFGGIGKIFGFASGTANTGGKRGEPAGVVHGQEAVIPLPAGGKVPVQINSPKVPTGTGSRDEVMINLQDDSGRMATIADQRIQTHSGTIVRVAVNQSYKQVKAGMPGLITDAQQRAL